jgi:hypothetical protein
MFVLLNAALAAGMLRKQMRGSGERSCRPVAQDGANSEFYPSAVCRIAREAPGQTLPATALAHEAWLWISGSDAKAWEGRQHFFAAAAEAVRRIPVQSARGKKRLKHGGNMARV